MSLIYLHDSLPCFQPTKGAISHVEEEHQQGPDPSDQADTQPAQQPPPVKATAHKVVRFRNFVPTKSRKTGHFAYLRRKTREDRRLPSASWYRTATNLNGLDEDGRFFSMQASQYAGGFIPRIEVPLLHRVEPRLEQDEADDIYYHAHLNGIRMYKEAYYEPTDSM